MSACVEPDELEENTALNSFADVWNQLVDEDALLKHCNDREISTRIVVPAALRQEVFRAFHTPVHNGYKATLRRIAKLFWLPHIRRDVSAFVKACEVSDRN